MVNCDRIYHSDMASACFFRSSVELPNRKIMIQITERCNLHCAHCFVNAIAVGQEMAFSDFKEKVLPALLHNNVTKVTLTGGEPLVHSNIKEIVELLMDSNIGISICTNGVLVDTLPLEQYAQYKKIHFNVSLDGMTTNSHGRFRGNMSQKTLNRLFDNIRLLGSMGLLNGILTTPNHYATIQEYVELCKFAKSAKANYLLMNPLSPFGRGTSTSSLAFSDEEMIELKHQTQEYISDNFEIIYIRFPNVEHAPVDRCALGKIPYVFCNGDIAVCPYMVFAANNDDCRYNPNQFMLGNIFDGIDLGASINSFEENFQKTISKELGTNCDTCKRGCYAIKISNNQPLSSWDREICS